MRSYNPDQIEVRFDDERLVADAGLLLPATLAVGLGLRQLVDEFVNLGDAPGRANAGDKAMTLVASALAGAAGSTTATSCAPGRPGRSWAAGLAPSTVGTFLRSFTWGSARQLDQVAAEALGRAWAHGAGPEPWPYTIVWDSTICEVYGLAKQGAAFGHTKVRGYHPLLAFGAGTGDLMHARLRGGNANTARGAAASSPRRSTGPCRRCHRAAYPAGRLGLLRPPGGQGLPVGRGALLDHRQVQQGGPQGDPADSR